jgi:protocatechuate 3,4-dioxygenase beta subunit
MIAAMTRSISRRELIAAAGVTGLGAAFGARGLFAPDRAVAGCVLQREVTEGPYYLDLDLVRRNIKGDRKGIPLTLRFAVIDASTCAVVKNANVEIWHADASGAYSGVGGHGGTWLRGSQRTNAKGQVRFETIFPGWYPGRTPHIHMKVFISGNEIHTGQVFFPPNVMKAIYGHGSYVARASVAGANTSDGIYRQAGDRALLGMKAKGTATSAGYNGSLTVGVNRS